VRLLQQHLDGTTGPFGGLGEAQCSFLRIHLVAIASDGPAICYDLPAML